jgi:hypothetical protein
LVGIVPIAAIFWWRHRVMLGSVVGAGLLLVVSLFFSATEFVDVDRLRLDCMHDVESACLAIAYGPSDFTRVGVYILVAFAQVAVLFLIGEVVERRLADSDRDPAWRR